jgi:hypothetical protein
LLAIVFTFLLRRGDVEYWVKLTQLPAEVSISGRLSERFRYDAERRELVYCGFMTKCAYDEISALSDNLEYHRAVEHLFVLTSAEVTPPRKSPSPRVMAAAMAAVVIVAALLWGSVRQSVGQRTASPPATATASTSR